MHVSAAGSNTRCRLTRLCKQHTACLARGDCRPRSGCPQGGQNRHKDDGFKRLQQNRNASRSPARATPWRAVSADRLRGAGLVQRLVQHCSALSDPSGSVSLSPSVSIPPRGCSWPQRMLASIPIPIPNPTPIQSCRTPHLPAIRLGCRPQPNLLDRQERTRTRNLVQARAEHAYEYVYEYVYEKFCVVFPRRCPMPARSRQRCARARGRAT
jgi:hypothetical protein